MKIIVDDIPILQPGSTRCVRGVRIENGDGFDEEQFTTREEAEALVAELQRAIAEAFG